MVPIKDSLNPWKSQHPIYIKTDSVSHPTLFVSQNPSHFLSHYPLSQSIAPFQFRQRPLFNRFHHSFKSSELDFKNGSNTLTAAITIPNPLPSHKFSVDSGRQGVAAKASFSLTSSVTSPPVSISNPLPLRCDIPNQSQRTALRKGPTKNDPFLTPSISTVSVSQHVKSGLPICGVNCSPLGPPPASCLTRPIRKSSNRFTFNRITTTDLSRNAHVDGPEVLNNRSVPFPVYKGSLGTVRSQNIFLHREPTVEARVVSLKSETQFGKPQQSLLVDTIPSRCRSIDTSYITLSFSSDKIRSSYSSSIATESVPICHEEEHSKMELFSDQKEYSTVKHQIRNNENQTKINLNHNSIGAIKRLNFESDNLSTSAADFDSITINETSPSLGLKSPLQMHKDSPPTLPSNDSILNNSKSPNSAVLHQQFGHRLMRQYSNQTPLSLLSSPNHSSQQSCFNYIRTRRLSMKLIRSCDNRRQSIYERIRSVQSYVDESDQPFSTSNPNISSIVNKQLSFHLASRCQPLPQQSLPQQCIVDLFCCGSFLKGFLRRNRNTTTTNR